MDLNKVIKERHCVRNFKTSKKPNYKEVIEAIEAATKAPLAGNIYAVKYILVQDKEKIKALATACQQDFVGSVDFIIVVCSDNKDVIRNYYERGKIYARQQAGAAIENLFLKITDLGLSTCWVGAFSDETIKRILKIPDNIDVEAIFPIGYELGKTEQETKPDLDRVLFFDEWKNKFMKPKTIRPGTEV
jgi:nitroreductase